MQGRQRRLPPELQSAVSLLVPQWAAWQRRRRERRRPLLSIAGRAPDCDTATVFAAQQNFDATLAQSSLPPLRRSQVTTVQINVGKVCNQACRHCHVDAGPKRTESMSRETADRVLMLLTRSNQPRVVDITGGAPELNPHFRHLVEECRLRGLHVIDRCNLTILLEPGFESLADFLASNSVEIAASLPCYTRENVDRQRGRGVFDKSIQALQLLNKIGYGVSDELPLNLVYNPLGPSLPPPQEALEADYKRHLFENFGIRFNRLVHHHKYAD